ncbi:MAG: AraC family transcriptional regulator [Bacteroidota bacterium]
MEEVEGNNVLHYDKIKSAETILTQHLNRNLPSVNDIAKQVALSESTLKRYFKVIFGTSIYEYYLQKKMEHAKTQLMENHLPVKEVAYMLGYEKAAALSGYLKNTTNCPGSFAKRGQEAEFR